MDKSRGFACYFVGFAVIWAAIFAIGYATDGVTPDRPFVIMFGGVLAGLAVIYAAMRVYASGGQDDSARNCFGAPRDRTARIGRRA